MTLWVWVTFALMQTHFSSEALYSSLKKPKFKFGGYIVLAF